jgi:hypothetical protein
MVSTLKISLLALFWLVLPWTAATAEAASEYAVKAAFIHNIAKFVEWPKPAAGGGKLRLCLLGKNPFGEEIAVLRGQPVGRMQWEVLPVSLDDIKSCEVLFIPDSMQHQIGQIRQRINGNAVLTVGDTQGYAERGVMINFYLEDNKVRFEINREVAVRAGLRISSQLLRLGRIVTETVGGK